LDMPEVMLLLVSGGESEGSYQGVRWKWSASAALPNRTFDVDGATKGDDGIIRVSGSAEITVFLGHTIGTLSLESDRPISLRFE
jgi:hypothetical protein